MLVTHRYEYTYAVEKFERDGSLAFFLVSVLHIFFLHFFYYTLLLYVHILSTTFTTVATPSTTTTTTTASHSTPVSCPIVSLPLSSDLSQTSELKFVSRLSGPFFLLPFLANSAFGKKRGQLTLQQLSHSACPMLYYNTLKHLKYHTTTYVHTLLGIVS